MSIRQADEDGDAAQAWPERVRVEGREVRTSFRVRYAETDRMGVAYYANYLVWFEVLRGDYMRAMGIPYTSLEADGLFLPIAESHVRYVASAAYDDPIDVVGWIEAVGSRAVTFSYRVERQAKVLATGSTRHVPVDPTGRPIRFPRELLDRLRGYTLLE